MKKRILLIENIIVFIFLILPPLIVNPGNISINLTKLSFTALIEFLIASLLFLQYKTIFSDNLKNSFFYTLIQNLKWNAITLAFLMLIYALFEAINLCLIKTDYQQLPYIMPESPAQWLIVILNLMFSAFCEEEIYRQFLPQSILTLTGLNQISIFSSKNKKNVSKSEKPVIKSEKNTLLDNPIPKDNNCISKKTQKTQISSNKSLKIKKIIVFIIEFICVMIFAFSHRYSGFIAVTNAFFCGIILRICFKKTNSILPGFIAHFTYNFLMILFTFLINNQ